MTGPETAPRRTAGKLCPEIRWVATNPECEGAQIFQTSHKQIAEAGRRARLAAAELYFLHKIGLNSEHLSPVHRSL